MQTQTQTQTQTQPQTQTQTLRLMPLLAICIGFAACAAELPPQPGPSEFENGMWVWSNEPATDENAGAALVELARDASLTTLYVQAQTLVYDAPVLLQQLVVRAAAAGVQVELLIGRPEWAQPEHAAEVIAIAHALATFAEHEEGPHAVALQVNIEPHALAAWQTNRDALLLGLIDILEQLRDIAHGSKLALSFDMPTWYSALKLQRHGQTRPMSEWVLDVVDTAVLMDYDDDVADIVAHAEATLAYAGVAGKRVVIGVETQCQLDDDLTFCEEGKAAMTMALAQVHAQLRTQKAYAGLAIHHWKSFIELAK